MSVEQYSKFRACEYCKKEFAVPEKWDVQRFCSRSCARKKPFNVCFWKRVNKSETCWNWIGVKDKDGYGTLSIRGKGLKRAHRLSWEIHNGPIPDGMSVLHKCDNPSCVNPEHLFLGTQLDNMRDKTAKGRGIYLKGEDAGRTKLTEKQVRQIRRMIEEGKTQRAIAKEFSITHGAVHLIAKRINWSHV